MDCFGDPLLRGSRPLRPLRVGLFVCGLQTGEARVRYQQGAEKEGEASHGDDAPEAKGRDARVTDYAKPATPAEAMRRFATHLEYRIQAHEAKVRDHQFAIAELREQWGEALNEAERYEKWQPKFAETKPCSNGDCHLPDGYAHSGPCCTNQDHGPEFHLTKEKRA